MKLEVGMYARVQELNEVTIVKILKVEDDGFNADSNMFYMFSEVIKASHNIIDLIEIGDYVNGHRIVIIFANENNGKKLLIALDKKDYEYSDKLEDYMCDDSIHIYEENIKTILTKEQFENNCYRIGD